MRRILVADSCVGGLSVIRSMRMADRDEELIFLADYAINPLGTKSQGEIRLVVDRWLRTAEAHADELVIACNTLSIRYAQLIHTGAISNKTVPVTSMVDYFSEMLERESAKLRNVNVLIVGTQFTSSQALFTDMLRTRTECADIETFAATQLERQIARFESGDFFADPGFDDALSRCDVAILACTCFPFVITALQKRFPTKRFLDPSQARAAGEDHDGKKQLVSVATTGSVVSPGRVTQFARECLGEHAEIRQALALGLE